MAIFCDFELTLVEFNRPIPIESRQSDGSYYFGLDLVCFCLCTREHLPGLRYNLRHLALKNLAALFIQVG